ncbi:MULTISPECIES: lipoate--protein ligase family protein [unclassified Cryobacterium]|jgi:lipoate-protein ligase A|uniref:lipoate--protein ligase family protein n=1 Tax=unclassified Cryobacterium TaxID=2649013 RepID=UPI00106B4694|nr:MULTISPECIES: lipoate--protein ligase family protein [unclassified Cryobacterium]TFD48019.1 lipoate--protein ligase family protein [Cryobacterium sp. Hh11]TFD63331.1 lipoate--protein ligase family protein [Cryobacterium sp. Hh38]
MDALLVTHSVGHGAAGDLDVSLRMLKYVAANPETPRLVRVYQPEPTVAFSRRESLLPGFPAAVSAAASHGFTPVIRPAGGRAVAYDESCLVVDLVNVEDGAYGGLDNESHFKTVGNQFADVLRELGVDARVGPVPGEYCPGTYSVNARGQVKLVGTAQRVTRGARLMSASIPVAETGALIDVLVAVNRELDFAWNERTFGSVLSETSGMTAGDVTESIVRAFAGHRSGEIQYHVLANRLES